MDIIETPDFLMSVLAIQTDDRNLSAEPKKSKEI